jgi:hypothetical protein
MTTEIKAVSTSKMALLRFGLACAILVAGVLALRSLAEAMNWHFNKPPTPLRRELPTVPRALGNPYKYEAVGQDLNMKPDELQTLGTDMYLLRNYADIGIRDRAQAGGPHEVGGSLLLNVNYYATGDGTVHVPNICWTAQNMVLSSERTFVVKGVPLADGSVVDIPVRLLSFDPTTPEIMANPSWLKHEAEHQLCVGYTFNVNGEYVNDRNEVRQKFWNAALPFAYHAKVEVKVNERCRPEEAQAAIDGFLRESLVEISKCFPDANELKAQAAAATQKTEERPGGTEPAVMKEPATRP